MATASRLIFEYGWKIDEIGMETSRSEFGEVARGVDIVVVGSAGKIPICCENKTNNYQFDKLLKLFSSCCPIGEHSKEECTDNEPECPLL